MLKAVTPFSFPTLMKAATMPAGLFSNVRTAPISPLPATLNRFCADNTSWGVRGGRRGAGAAAVADEEDTTVGGRGRADPGAVRDGEELPDSLTSSGPSSGASESESASTAALPFLFLFLFLFLFFFATLALNCRNTSLVASSFAASSGVCPYLFLTQASASLSSSSCTTSGGPPTDARWRAVFPF
ncbi:hypothetical protein B484DRAFT_447112, partial [Ochromonadaceae sp. CCMP2298]